MMLGVDANDMSLVSIDEIIEFFNESIFSGRGD